MCPVVKEFTKLDIELKIICEISGLCNEINQDYKNRDKKYSLTEAELIPDIIFGFSICYSE